MTEALSLAELQPDQTLRLWYDAFRLQIFL